MTYVRSGISSSGTNSEMHRIAVARMAPYLSYPPQKTRIIGGSFQSAEILTYLDHSREGPPVHSRVERYLNGARWTSLRQTGRNFRRLLTLQPPRKPALLVCSSFPRRSRTSRLAPPLRHRNRKSRPELQSVRARRERDRLTTVQCHTVHRPPRYNPFRKLRLRISSHEADCRTDRGDDRRQVSRQFPMS